MIPRRRLPPGAGKSAFSIALRPALHRDERIRPQATQGAFDRGRYLLCARADRTTNRVGLLVCDSGRINRLRALGDFVYLPSSTTPTTSLKWRRQ